MDSHRGVRTSLQRSPRGPGQQEPAVRFQPPTSVHHHGEKGHRQRIDAFSLGAPRRRRLAPAFHPSGCCLNEPFIYSLCVIWSFIQAPSSNTSICITAHNHSLISSLRSSAAPLVFRSPLSPPSVSLRPLSFHLPLAIALTSPRWNRRYRSRNEIITNALQESNLLWSSGASAPGLVPAARLDLSERSSSLSERKTISTRSWKMFSFKLA